MTTKKNQGELLEVLEAKVAENEIAYDAMDHLPSTQITPMTLIERALATDTSIEKLEQLFELQLRYEENEAKKAFHKAFAAFKSQAIEIIKTKNVSFMTGKGKTEYNHAELGNIVAIVTPHLSKYGLSQHWEYAQPENQVEVTCVLTHELGYSKQTTLRSARDDSGGKNSIQAIASATSYLERYTFLAITGLASKDQDDDGKQAGPKIETINEEQISNIDILLRELKRDVKGFCTFFKVDSIEAVPAIRYDDIVRQLEGWRRA